MSQKRVRKTKSPQKSKSKSEYYLSLEGEVSLIEKRGDKIVSKEVIEGKLVLECLLNLIKVALQDYEKSTSEYTHRRTPRKRN